MIEKTLEYLIPIDQLRTIGPNIDQVYLMVLATLTATKLSSNPVTDFKYEQGDVVERTAQYGDHQLGLTMSAEPIQSGYGIHGESATWHFVGLPPGIQLVGYSRIDYRGIGKQYIAIVVHSADPGLFSIVKTAFHQATAI